MTHTLKCHTWHTAYNLADQVTATEQPATGQQGAGQATTFTANYFSTTSLHGIVDAVVGIMVHYPPVWLALALDFILDTIASGIGYNKISDAARSAKLPCDCSRFSCDCE